MHGQSNSALGRIPGITAFLFAGGALVAALWGRGRNINEIGAPFGVSAIFGLIALSIGTVSTARRQSGWISLTLTLALVGIAFAIWIVYAWGLGDLYDSRS